MTTDNKELQRQIDQARRLSQLQTNAFVQEQLRKRIEELETQMRDAEKY